MSLSVSSNKTGIIFETYGVMWHFAQESKTKLVSYELSPKVSLGHSALPDISDIDAYIYWSMIFCSSCMHDYLFY